MQWLLGLEEGSRASFLFFLPDFIFQSPPLFSVVLPFYSFVIDLILHMDWIMDPSALHFEFPHLFC